MGFLAVLFVATVARVSYLSSYLASPFNQYYAGDHRYYRHWKHNRAAISSGSTSTEASDNLAMMLVVRPGQHDTVEAIRLATAACTRTDWRNPKCMLTLAMAYHKDGRCTDAIALLERAINVAREQGLVGRHVQLETMLKTYRKDAEN